MHPDQSTAPLSAAIDPAKFFALPLEGEALLTPVQLSAALGISEASLWSWAKHDPEFPRPVRRGERFTRFRLTDARRYIASLSEGKPKAPRNRAIKPASVEEQRQ